MKIFRLFAATLFLAAIAALPTYAQQRNSGAAAAQPAAPQTSNAPVPATKIAFVNTEVFRDEKQGITRYVAAMKNLEREFQPSYTELQTMANRIKTLADELSKLNAASNAAVIDQKSIQAKQEEGERLQRELKFKKEDAEARFQKRYQEVVGPISQDIGKALDAFAKQRGITMILDVSKMIDSILTVDESMDVTAAFITEYNSKNPATASTAAPGR